MLENGQMATLNMKDILPNRFQPRIRFDELKLNELAASIRKYGLIQPIVVRQIGTKYEIIAGERRYKASELANKETIPAIIVTLSDRDSEEIALLENIQREDLTPIEEAVSYKRILDVGYITQEELARKIGKSQSAIANKIRLLTLDDTVQDALLRGKISERHARSLLRISNLDEQVKMLNRIINERLTVKMTDHAIRDLLESESSGDAKEMESVNPDKKIETLSTTDSPVRRAVPVASHRIIKVNPPKELEEKLKTKEEEESDTMDIDKILEEAQDITPQDNVKPAGDIADLMKQNPNTLESPLIKSEVATEPETVATVEPGKFVTPMAGAQPQTESVQTSTPSAVSFDSIFNQTPVGVQPEQPVQPTINTMESTPTIENVTPSTEVPVQNLNPVEPNGMSTGGVSNENIMPQTEAPTIPVMPSEPVMAPTEPIVSEPAPISSEASVLQNPVNQTFVNPVSEPINDNTMINNQNEINNPNMFGGTSTVQTGNFAEPVIDNSSVNNMPVTEPSGQSNTLQEQPINNFNNAFSQSVPSQSEQNLFESLPSMNNTPIGESTIAEPTPLNPVQMEPVQASLDGQNLGVNVNQNNIAASMPTTPTINIPDDNIIETNNQVMPEQAIPSNNAANFRQVISLIRNCASEIEKLGYFIDVDEIDLDNKYQVTFKIDKE